MISENNQGRGRDYQPKPEAEADNPYRELDYSGYHKKLNLVTVLLYIERNKTSHVFASSLTASNTKQANLT